MSKFMVLKINNSKDASIKSGKWKDPGAKLYDQLLNAAYFASDDVDDPRNENVWYYLRETYLIAPVKDIKYGPYGQTPYSRSGCKYPHHVIRNGELIVHEAGLKAAYSRAKQMGIFSGEVKEHLERHYKELGLYENSTMRMDETLEQNFDFIENYIYENTGIDLYSPTQLFEERSHGSLKSSFRIVKDVETGHNIKLVFNLNKEDIKEIDSFPSDPEKNRDPKIINRIRHDGHNDFKSTGTLKAIIDLETGKKLNKVIAMGPIYGLNHSIEYVVGKKETIPTFKATSGKTHDKKGNYLPDQEINQTNIDHHGKVWSKNHQGYIHKARHLDTPSNFNTQIFKNEISKISNDVKILFISAKNKIITKNSYKILCDFREDFIQNSGKAFDYCQKNNKSQALYYQDKCINIKNKLENFLNSLHNKNIIKESYDLYQETLNCIDDIEQFIFEQSQPPPNRVWAEIHKLPKVYQDLVKDINSKILSKMESLIKNNPEYKRLNEKETIDELKKSMTHPKVMGAANLHKKPKSCEGSIFITGGNQDYKFYHTDRDKYAIDEVYKPIYPIYLNMLKEIEKNLKPEFEKYKEIGLTFILRGDPVDQIHEFEFDLSEEAAEELWKYVTDTTRNKTFKEKLFQESSLSEDHIYPLKRKDVTSPYFVKWLFQTDEFSDYDPEKFDYDILIHNPNVGNYAYGYYVNNLEGIIRVRYRENEDYYGISMLFVNSNSEGSGIGQSLLKYAIDKFGHKELRLNVFTTNERAIHIYKKYGFEVADTITVKDEPGVSSKFVGKKMYKMVRLSKNKKEGLKMESMDSGDLSWIEGYMMEEGENTPQETGEKKPAPQPQPKKEEPKPEPEKKESMPKKTDRAESDKNGVRRKKLYIAFIEWAKGINPKNTFGSIFDKDAFHSTYPFVPEDMRYFYRLANPMLCVLTGDLTFFAVAELRKLNIKNSRLSEMMIFAATKEDVRVFNKKDKKVYRGTEENGMLKLAEVLGETFDLYIQKMINQGDILNGPLEESVDMFPPGTLNERRIQIWEYQR